MLLKRYNSVFIFTAAIALLLFTFACGSDNNSASNNNGGTNNGGNTGSANTGNGGGSSTYYQAALMSDANGTMHGTITLGSNGSGTLQLQNATPNVPYAIQFCQFPNGSVNCLYVGSTQFTPNASGNASGNYTFTKSGTWAGILHVMPAPTSTQPANGAVGYSATFAIPANGTTYQTPLVRASEINGGVPSFLGPAGTDPLTSGTVTISNGTTAHISLTGASPNTSYAVGYCGNGGGSSCYGGLGTVTTDASGNGSADIATNNYNAPGVYSLGRGSDVQFMTGVKVP